MKSSDPAPPKRRGRRRGDSGTREAILRAGRQRFAAHGYAGTGMRDVAADAGVDPALVHYFFKTKHGLFLAALELPYDPVALVARAVPGDPDAVGERLARGLLDAWSVPDGPAKLAAFLRAAATHEPTARAARELSETKLIPLLASAAADPDPELRAAHAASHVVGVMFARFVFGLSGAGVDAGTLAPPLADALQQILRGPRAHGTGQGP